MNRMDEGCVEFQLNAVVKNDKGLLASIAKSMLDSGADYAAVSGQDANDEDMYVVVLCVGPRALAFKKFLDKFDDLPTRKSVKRTVPS